MAALFFANFLRFVLIAVGVLVFARVVLSYVDPAGRGSVARFVVQMTEPILAPIRRMLPRTGAFDFSTFLVLVVIGAILRYIP